ncbi:putative ribonuclease H-like domain-containing protein [Tanacetum coccineum]
MLLIELPNEHLMTFNQYKDAKTLFAAIQTRFVGNEATKKTQKTLLKQIYKNFSASSTKSLDSIFNRLQLAILDTMSFDNLYNNIKIVEQEVKRTASSSLSSSSQNMAFVSSPSSTNEVNTAYGVSTANTQVSPTSTQVSTASTQVSTASTQVSTANLSDATIYAFLANQPNGSQLVHEDLEQIHEDDLEEMDLKWQLALLSMRTRSSRRTVNVEETSSKSMVAIDGAGFDWSYMADNEVPTNMALMAFSDSEFNKSEFNLATYKRGLASVEEQLVFYKKNEVIFYEQLAVLKRDISYKDSEISMLKRSQITGKSRKGVGFVSYNVVPSSHKGLFSSLNLDLSYTGLEEFQQPKFEGYGPKTSKSVSEDISNEVRESSNAPLVEELVSDDKLEKKTIFPTVAKIEFVRPKQQEKPVRKPVKYAEMYRLNAITIKGKGWPKAINTTRPNSAVVNAVRENQVNVVKALACWVWRPTKLNSHPQKEDQGYVDSGCSRHMTGNMSYLSDFKDFDRGYVTFGGGSKRGKITSKGTLKTVESNTKPLDETSGIIKSFITKIENLVDKKVKIIRCDNGTEFKNRVMSEFCEKKGIKKEFSIARTPQQNGVAERRNRTLIKAARTMVLVVKPYNKTPYELFRGRTPALSFMRPFGCHVTILNTLDYLGKFDGKSDEGFFVGYSMNSKAFRVYNIRTRKVEENLHIRFLEDKPIIAGDGPKWLFDIDVLTKSMNYVPVVAGTNSNDLVGTEESIGAGHSSKETRSSHDYILMPLWKDGSLFDSSSKNASNDEPQPSSDAGKKYDEGVNKESRIENQERPKNSTQDVYTTGPSINTTSTNVNTGSLNINNVSPTVTTALLEATHVDFFIDEIEVDISNITTTYLVPSTLNTRIHKDHSLDHVIGDVQFGVQIRRMTKTTNDQGFISVVYEGKTLKTFILVCLLVSYPRKSPKRAIGTKWVYKNKKDKRGIMIRNKARLVALGYTQEEGIDYDEVFAPVARIEAIRLFLAYASFKDFVVYQMDVKSAFMFGKIEEEVYVCQPPGFEDPEFPNRVYKVEQSLYGLHQDLRAWYETLSTYLLDNRFQRGHIDKTLFIKRVKSDILLVQVYVDDIIFGSTKKELCTEFEKLMHKKFQISSMGELTFFLGLQVTQKDDGIFISQDKYVDEILKKFGFSTVKTASTPMETSKPLMKDENAEDVDVHLYRSMIGSLMYLTSSRPNIMFTFWETATVRTLDTGEFELTATIDGNVKIVTEASVRRHLQLADSDGSTHPVESHHIPTNAPSTSQPPISPTSRSTIRQESIVPQPRSPTQTHVADEAASTGVDVKYGGVATNVTGLESGTG